jgi:hypothetical protein
VTSACACASSTLRSCAPQSPHRSDSPAIAAAAPIGSNSARAPQQIWGGNGEQTRKCALAASREVLACLGQLVQKPAGSQLAREAAG